MDFYVDTCIWLNLFKKEGDSTKGKPYWKIAQCFVKKVRNSKENRIIYSGFILKEMRFKVEKSLYERILKFFKEENNMFYFRANLECYTLARKFESESNYSISFIDCMNIAICKQLDSLLVTRDKKLIQFAKKYIRVKKPEELK